MLKVFTLIVFLISFSQASSEDFKKEAGCSVLEESFFTKPSHTTLSQNLSLCYIENNQSSKALALSYRNFYLNPFVSSHSKMKQFLEEKLQVKSHSILELFYIYTPFSLLFLLISICLYFLGKNLLGSKDKLVFLTLLLSFLTIPLYLKSSFFLKKYSIATENSPAYLTPKSPIESLSLKKGQRLEILQKQGDWLQISNLKGEKAWVLDKKLYPYWRFIQKPVAKSY